MEGTPVVSQNTNELKTGSPGRFGLEMSTLDWPMGARILDREHASPVLVVAIADGVWSKYSNAQRVRSLHVSRIDADIEDREDA